MSHLNESRSIIAKPNAFLYLRPVTQIQGLGACCQK